MKAQVHVITGSVEITPLIGLGDAIFDIVSSGSTLVTNNLKEVENVVDSDAVIIANRSLSPEKKETVKELLFRFQAAIDAQKKKYVMMNAPKDKIKAILDILPECATSILSPSVMAFTADLVAQYTFPPAYAASPATEPMLMT